MYLVRPEGIQEHLFVLQSRALVPSQEQEEWPEDGVVGMVDKVSYFFQLSSLDQLNTRFLGNAMTCIYRERLKKKKIPGAQSYIKCTQ